MATQVKIRPVPKPHVRSSPKYTWEKCVDTRAVVVAFVHFYQKKRLEVSFDQIVAWLQTEAGKKKPEADVECAFYGYSHKEIRDSVACCVEYLVEQKVIVRSSDGKSVYSLHSDVAEALSGVANSGPLLLK